MSDDRYPAGFRPGDRLLLMRADGTTVDLTPPAAEPEDEPGEVGAWAGDHYWTCGCKGSWAARGIARCAACGWRRPPREGE